MFQTDDSVERVILIAVETDDSTEASLDELALLAETAGAVVVGRLTQKREAVHAGHYFGKGKLEELRTEVSLHDATGVICDDELTSSQLKNMEKILDIKIMDRTMVILDIFAAHARTAEGKVQVNLALQKYRLSHLAGLGTQLSRTGGGIGTRGPGETKLETDRRHIRERISELNRELREIVTARGVLREKREKTGIPVVSLVGYTNAGKSTLMNCLTDAGVLAENKLFATLDTTTRRLTLPGGSDVLLTDTVGFINKLPHQLIQAFKATLEELKFADILLHVVDASSPTRDVQMKVVNETLAELDSLGKPVITVYNKCDLDASPVQGLRVSALTGENTGLLLEEIENVLKTFRKPFTALIPFTEGRLLSAVHTSCEILSEEHGENGTLVTAYGDEKINAQLSQYMV